MSSPIPPDPYQALGVPKDADISTIRTAHRKLVLRLHPDRIKDEAEKLKGKDEFQKVQQAYEILSDAERRTRYDDRVKLAQLRKEAMMSRDVPTRSATYPMRPAPPSSTFSSTRYARADGNVYEERAPAENHTSRDSFSSRERYEDEPSRPSSRKHDDFDRRTSGGKSSEKERSKKSGWDSGVSGMSVKMGIKLKSKAAQAKSRVSERSDKEREREKNAEKARNRDKEQRRDRSDKQEKQRRAFVVDADSSSDSDTATQFTSETIRPRKTPVFETVRPTTSPRSKLKRDEPKRSSGSRRYEDDEEEENYDNKWERHHESTLEYIQNSSKRPGMNRTDSHQFWHGEERSRRSGSDSDKRPTSSKGRRSEAETISSRPPSMPMHNSAPGNLRNPLEDRSPSDRPARDHQRSASGQIPVRDHRQEIPTVPTFSRSQTMPSSRSSKKDTAPSRGSNLKHAETHDSGYGSSSSPHTPELNGTSPTRESRRELPRTTSSRTKYHIVDPETPTVILDDDSDRNHRFQRSPSPSRERRVPERPRVSTSDRSKSSRVSSSQSNVGISSSRPSTAHRTSGREQTRSPRDSPPISRHNSGRGERLFAEMSGEDSPTYSRKFDEDKIKYANYGQRSSQDERERDYMPNSRHRDHIKHPEMGSRRGSVY